ncbi:MAG TPA: urea carboxylase [Candidatus Dormibacteraeota bacterium]|nr:urea carboxylase [Candidatus Dormibacteraeota bacterium]
MFRKVLIANRGAIACRIIRTLRNMGVDSVAVYSEADRQSLHVDQAHEAVCLGPAPAAQSYLSIPALLKAAKETRAEAIHPGYGFLSENAAFAEACAEHGVVFIGPTPQQMRDFGLKHTARKIAAKNGVPMLPGTDVLQDVNAALRAAEAVGYPLMLKSTSGGGGIGMRLCVSADELRDAYEAVSRQSQASFGSGSLYLERFVTAARHIEVQIFGDGRGSVIALGERDCSVQRRNQKVIEETPAPGLQDEIRRSLLETAVRLGKAVRYQSAGTVEFIYDSSSGEFYFLEVNTRLQVEHGVTEEVTGIDLVEWMVKQAAGEMPALDRIEIPATGSSIQVRLYAEDPAKEFQPSAGRLMHVHWPDGARVETWVDSGTEVTPFYDPMLAKVIVWGADRMGAIEKLRAALAETELSGIETNLSYLRQISESGDFAAGSLTTSFLKSFHYHRHAIDVLEPGTQTTIQDLPGRLGYWHVGVPPSGPMDPLAFRLANRLAGNEQNTAGLEITLTGPTLRFASDTIIALAGADFGARLNGHPMPRWQAVAVKQNSVLKLGSAQHAGARAYLAVAGGIDTPPYLGSRSTFILGKFGGQGRVLRAGDVLHLNETNAAPGQLLELPESIIPKYSREWEIGVLYGPHGSPDFFTPEDIAMFFSTAWKVHYNSDRTGVRLIGPKPRWARKDGGEAGLHPSNIHDNAYAVGTVDFTGDMPVILGPDGPSLGGFVCPATIVEAEIWKMGQLKAGDTVRFRRLSSTHAEDLRRQLEKCLGTLAGALPQLREGVEEDAIIRSRAASNGAPAIVCRADGDRCLLVEYGPNVLDLNLRFRVHALEQQLRAANLPGILDITPGVRSMHIHYDARLRREELLEALDACERRIPDLENITVESRVVHLPLSWDDPATQLAIRKYMQSVRPDAPWCPSNIEFIRRINGLNSINDVHRIVFGASYLVLGLGDVYLGAPVATPVDPRHRLVTTKYNPARTWTAENSVGIGGAYLCVYGMEGPGGYQFVGRTLQMWNTFHSTTEFPPGTPWLLRFFDELRFYPVSARELLEIREAFPRGRYPLRIEPQHFRLREYHDFLRSIKTEAEGFKRQQQAAFEAERERWSAAGQAEYIESSEASAPALEADVPEGCAPVRSPISASVWNVTVEAGQRVEAGQKLMILEAMKTEIAVTAPRAGIVESLSCAAGALVWAGQTLLLLRGEAAA